MRELRGIANALLNFSAVLRQNFTVRAYLSILRPRSVLPVGAALIKIASCTFTYVQERSRYIPVGRQQNSQGASYGSSSESVLQGSIGGDGY